MSVKSPGPQKAYTSCLAWGTSRANLRACRLARRPQMKKGMKKGRPFEAQKCRISLGSAFTGYEMRCYTYVGASC